MALASGKVGLWNAALIRIGETEFIQSETEQNNPALEICKLRWDELVRLQLEAAEWPFATSEVGLSSIATQSRSYAGDASVNLKFDIPWAYQQSSQLVVTFTVSGGSAVELTAETHYTVTTRTGTTQQYITLTSTFTGTYGTPVTADLVTIAVTFAREGWDYVYALPSDCVTPRALLHNDKRLSLTHPFERLEFAVMVNDAGDNRVLCTNAFSTHFNVLEYTRDVNNIFVWSSHFKEALIWRLASELADGLRKDPKVAERCLGRYEKALTTALGFERNFENQRAEPMTQSEMVRDG